MQTTKILKLLGANWCDSLQSCSLLMVLILMLFLLNYGVWLHVHVTWESLFITVFPKRRRPISIAVPEIILKFFVLAAFLRGKCIRAVPSSKCIFICTFATLIIKSWLRRCRRVSWISNQSLLQNNSVICSLPYSCREFFVSLKTSFALFTCMDGP